jgi:hypothetical protein
VRANPIACLARIAEQPSTWERLVDIDDGLIGSPYAYVKKIIDA